MSLEQLLQVKHVFPALRVTSKKQCFRELARCAAAVAPLNERDVLSLLLERESLGNTATGHGVAIPHARIKGLEKPWSFFARLKKPVDFDADDGEPVDLVFLLLAPSSSLPAHRKSLAKVYRILHNPDIRQQLRNAGSAAEIFEILTCEGSDTLSKHHHNTPDARQAV